MHDFCFTFPYGIAIAIGGLLGYLRRGSTYSLIGGSVFGTLFLLAGYLSLGAFHKGSNSYFAMIVQPVLSATLTWVMGQRYLETGKIMPAGVVAVTSGLMTLYYVYKVATGGNHIVKKKN